MRAVNQGIGRVIRHINDYGLILMMDIRYDSAKLKALLPAWATPSMMTYNSFNDLDVKLKPFYDTMQSKFPSKEKQIEDPV